MATTNPKERCRRPSATGLRVRPGPRGHGRARQSFRPQSRRRNVGTGASRFRTQKQGTPRLRTGFPLDLRRAGHRTALRPARPDRMPKRATSQSKN